MSNYQYIKLTDRPELKDIAAEWFHNKWGVPKEAYLECMDGYLCGATKNVCAVYTEEKYRGKGIAGELLNLVVEDMRKNGVSPLYLITDHTSYERYGWEFYCMVQGDGEPEPTRMYIHR